MSDEIKPEGFSRFLPRYWLPNKQGNLFLVFIGFLILHMTLALVPYICEEWLGWHRPWSDEGAWAGLVGPLLLLMLVPGIAAAASHRKLCYLMKDRYNLLTLAFCGMLTTTLFGKIAKDAVDHTVGGSEIWYAVWGLTAIYILKPGMDHILDIAQPKL